MEIKNIIFDVGNVLVCWDPYAVFKNYFKNRAEVESFLKEIDFENVNLAMDKGLSFKEAIGGLVKKFPQYKDAIEAYDKNWLSSITGEVEGSLNLIEELKKAKYNIYGLTNFSREKFDICVQKYPFADSFDGLVVSADVNETKPSEKIYKILLSKYNLKPEESVFIDDKKENVDAAKLLGVNTILFENVLQARESLKKMGVKI